MWVGWVARLCVVFGGGLCPACVVVWVCKAGGLPGWFSPRFFFFLCGVGGGVWACCLRLGWVVFWLVGLRRIKWGARPAFVGCVVLFGCCRAGLWGAACVLVR